MAMKVWHWPFLAQPEPLPEMLISKGAGRIPRMENGELDQGEESVRLRSARAGSLPRGVLRSAAHPCALRGLSRRPLRRSSPMTRPTARLAKTIDCPLLALWGGAGIANETGGPLKIWKQWAPKATGKPVDSGHFLTEENPEATTAALLEFFTAA